MRRAPSTGLLSAPALELIDVMSLTAVRDSIQSPKSLKYAKFHILTNNLSRNCYSLRGIMDWTEDGIR